MKNTILATILILLSLAFFGCADENLISTNDSSQTQTIVYQNDSIGIVTDSTGWIYLTETYTSGINTSKIRVEFDGITNLSDNCSRNLYVSASQRYTNFFSYYVDSFSTINRHHSLIIENICPRRSNFNLNFIAQIINNADSGIKYLYFKNIRVYSLSD